MMRRNRFSVFRFQQNGSRGQLPRHAKRKAESGKRKLSAAEVGTAHHKFLQHVALEKAGEWRGARGRGSTAGRENAFCRRTNARFWIWKRSPRFGIRGRADKSWRHAENVKRELAFTARFSPAELAEIIGAKAEAGLENEFVVVQGVADLVVLLPEEIWLVDFKTD